MRGSASLNFPRRESLPPEPIRRPPSLLFGGDYASFWAMMIRFGTSGWRGVMGEEFTFHNVRVVIQAAANYLRAKHGDKPVTVVVGYDTRFLSDRYALEAAKL